MKNIKLFESFDEKTYKVYRGDQGNGSLGMFYTDSREVARYFNDKISKFVLTFNNPFVVESPKGSSVHFSDVRSRLKEVLDGGQMKSVLNFDAKMKKKNPSKIYSSSGKFLGYGKPGDEISVDTFGKWVQSLGKYDGVIFKNIEEADDMSIESTTYIAFDPQKQAKLVK